ncbi:response regulator [Deltaproteobacteria bacterium TL4]
MNIPERILIVDDDPALRDLLFSALGRKTAYQLESAVNGEDALEKYQSHPCDLMIMDLKMPVMDGITLLKELKERSWNVAVIVLTGHGSLNEAFALLNDFHISDFLMKPVQSLEMLIFSIRKALEQRKLRQELQQMNLTLEMKVKERTSELRKAKNDLELSKANFFSIVNQSNDGLMILDIRGIIQFVNPMTEILLNTSKENLLGSPFAISATGEKPIELTIHRKNGEQGIAEMKSSETEWQGKKAILATLRDITERKQHEVQLENYGQKLSEVNSSKDTFFLIISHDLKGPLTGMRKMTDLLIEDLTSFTQEEILDFATRINLSAIKLQELLENLLQWSRLSRGHLECRPEIVDLTEVIEKTLSLFSENAKSKNIKLAHTVPAATVVLTDYDMLSTVLQNLVSNAIKFTHPGGEVLIGAKPRIAASQTKNDEPQTLNFVEISVSDNGVGIPEKHLDKLFKIEERYSQKGTAGEQGTSLGLVLCKEFVVKNGGEIQVQKNETSVSGGTVFTFTLPATETVTAQPEL